MTTIESDKKKNYTKIAEFINKEKKMAKKSPLTMVTYFYEIKSCLSCQKPIKYQYHTGRRTIRPAQVQSHMKNHWSTTVCINYSHQTKQSKEGRYSLS